MSNTHNIRQRFLRTGLLTAGMTLLMIGSHTPLQAQNVVTEQGSTITMAKEIGLHAAAANSVTAMTMNAQIVFGMFLVLLGLFIHALIVVNEDHPVPVHAAKKNKKEEGTEEAMITKIFFMSWK